MKKLKTILHVIKHSLFPIDDYYIKVRKHTPFSFSLKYLVSLVLVSSVTLVILLPLHFLPIYQPTKLKSQFTETFAQLPKNLVVSINDFGVLNTNQPRPIIIFNQDQNSPERLLVIDPMATDDMIKEYDARFLLLRRKAIMKSYDQEIVWNYRTDRPITINSQSIENITSFIEELFSFYWVFLIVIMLFFLILIPAVFVLSKILYVTFASFIVYLIIKLFSIKHLSFKKTLQIGMHASTAPIILEFTSMLFHISIPIKVWFFILTLVFISAAVFEAYTGERKSKD